MFGGWASIYRLGEWSGWSLLQNSSTNIGLFFKREQRGIFSPRDLDNYASLHIVAITERCRSGGMSAKDRGRCRDIEKEYIIYVR